VKGLEDGSVAVPARIFHDITRELEGIPIEVGTEDGRESDAQGVPGQGKVRILSDRGTYRIPCDVGEDFPRMPVSESPSEEAQSFSIQGERLARMVGKTLFAVSKDELRPALMGVLFQIRNRTLTLVATDGHRLVRIIDKKFLVPLSPSAGQALTGQAGQTGAQGLAQQENIGGDFIVPAKALQLLLRNLSETTGPIQVRFGSNFVVFNLPAAQASPLRAGNQEATDKSAVPQEFAMSIYSRLVESKYPDYERVIPTENRKRLVVNRELISSCVRRVSILSNAITHQVRFSLKADHMEVSAENVDIGGEAREVIPVQYDGDEMDIGYNAHYILDILKHLDSEEVIFLLNTPLTAGIVLPSEQVEGEDLMMLVMPVRLEE